MGTSCWSEEYLLAHAEGDPVETESGERIGVVEAVLFSPDDEPEALVVSPLGRARPVEIPLAGSEVRVLGEHLVVPDAVARLLRT